MADIKLTVNGENRASGALDEASRAVKDLGATSAQATQTSAEEVAKATEKWRQFGEMTREALRRIVEFAVESVKSYAESERASRQLERAAGDLSSAFEAQSKALSDRLAIDDDVIKNQQTLLLQWGAAPKDIEKATVAILDYAAATGKDAQTATVEFIKAVETGGGRLKALGIDFEATGNKTKDLEALTASLAKKFGGAADTDAQSLVGSLRAAKVAWDDFGKAFGEVLSSLLDKSGIIGDVTEALKGMQTALTGGDAQQKRYAEQDALYGELNRLTDAMAEFKKMSPEALAEFDKWAAGHGAASSSAVGSRLSEVQARLAELRKAGQVAGGETLGDKPLNGGNTTAKAKELEAAQKTQDEAYQKALDAREKHDRDAIKEDRDFTEKMAEEDKKQFDKRVKNEDEMLSALDKLQADHQTFEREQAKKFDDARLKQEEETLKKEAELIKTKTEKALHDAEEQGKKWKKVGDEIGAALANGIASEIEKLASGGEIDIGEMVGDILATVVGIAATAIGTYFGAPAVGAAVGNLAAVGIRLATAKKKYHEGGWVEGDEVPRYHDGSWIGPTEQPAILQHGERVLSRAEVQSMGGASQVDQAARGGGARMVINVSSLDAKSTAEAFEDRSGRGFWRAIRSGHGDLPRLLGGIVR